MNGSEPAQLLTRKIEDRSAAIVVMGVGYAGLPLVVELARAGYKVTGLDVDEHRVRELNEGRSHVGDVDPEGLRRLVEEERIVATGDASVLHQADVVVVCVPTPLNKTREPEMKHIVEATEAIAKHRKEGMLVVLESTTYPGTTRELLAPILTRAGGEVGEDVFLAFSPERVDPGNQTYQLRNTPKVIAGLTPTCLELARGLYATMVDELVSVSSTETAETVKLLENTFRAVNIGLANELAVMCRKLGVDPFEVIDAAATKPFGFMPFYPGPGLGGHCLPVDPLYLSWKMQALQHEAQFIGLADRINGAMPGYTAHRLAEILQERGQTVRGSRVLIWGVAYKPDVADSRESPALGVIGQLLKRGAEVSYLDPLIPTLCQDTLSLESVPENADFSSYDAIVVVTPHASLPRQRLLTEAKVILDARGALRSDAKEHDSVFRL